MGMMIIFVILVVAVIVNVVAPAGEGALGAREATWLLTLAAFAAMLAVAGRSVRSRWDGIFIGRENRISLARFQLILWVALIVSAFFTAALTNMTAGGNGAPLAIAVPPEIWGLLGLGSFTAVAAPAITEGQKRVPFGNAPAQDSADEVKKEIKVEQELQSEGQFVNRVYVKDAPEDARWIDLIKGDYEGAAHVDVSKLQQLVFTVLLVVTYGFALWFRMSGNETINGLPEPDPSFLALLGISHATYLADKQIGST